MIDQIHAWLQQHNIDISFAFDQGVLRNEAQWAVGETWKHGDTLRAKVHAGNFRTGETFTWVSWGSEKLTKEELKEAKTQTEQINKKLKEDRETTFNLTAALAKEEFDSFQTTGTTPYMGRKLISSLYGARIKDNGPNDPILVVPLRDVEGKIWNYQRIYSQKLSKGDKFFREDSRIDGLFHQLESEHVQPGSPPTGPIYICEGFATASSVFGALGERAFVVAAFNAGNLHSVSLALHQKYPDQPIVVCADNDAYTKIKNVPYNTGIEKGRRAAGSVGGSIVYPIFKYPKVGSTDFNDMHQAEGLDTVRDQILHPEKYVTGIQPMCLEVDSSGKTKQPSEEQVVNHILNYYGEKLVKSETELFRYTGTHWSRFEQRDIDTMENVIASMGILGNNKIKAAYNRLATKVKHVPRGLSLYLPNPYLANFQNGTLHLDPDKQVVFREHDLNNYCINVLPFDCPPMDLSNTDTPMFDAWVNRLWPEPDQSEIVKKLLFELLGSCLTPAYPNITFFIGESNSGKSTLVKFLVTAVSRENTCQVQLCEMKGFDMDVMVGKLVNYDTELDLNRPIEDVMVKKIVDRIPVDVKRKFKTSLSAYLPAVHIFAANDLPPTLDGQSKAYGRRIIVVKTSAPLNHGEETRDFEKIIWEKEGPALITKAVEALKRLHSNGGVFTVPPGSREMVREMETESDIVAQFLESVEQGEVKNAAGRLVFRPDLTMKKGELFGVFKGWMDECNIPQYKQLTERMVFRSFKKKFNTTQKNGGGRVYDGVGLINGAGVQVEETRESRIDGAT